VCVKRGEQAKRRRRRAQDSERGRATEQEEEDSSRGAQQALLLARRPTGLPATRTRSDGLRLLRKRRGDFWLDVLIRTPVAPLSISRSTPTHTLASHSFAGCCSTPSRSFGTQGVSLFGVARSRHASQWS